MTRLFLEEGNVPGTTLLRLVARGNSIVAEIQRLAKVVPDEFAVADGGGTAVAGLTAAQRALQAEQYRDILVDFAYFNNQEYYDNKLEVEQASGQRLRYPLRALS
jgi:WASH complex subunit strumpellin